MKLKSNRMEHFSTYSQFNSLEEFNFHMKKWLTDHPFTKSELLGLNQLIRFSAKYPGVCNAKIGTILKATHTNQRGISRSTFKRLLQKCIKIGLLIIHETTRQNGSQTSNLYVFQRYSIIPNEPAESRNMDQPKETKNNLETNNNKSIKERKDDLDASYTSDSVPMNFTLTVQGFFNSAKQIEEYWKMAKIAAYLNNREEESEYILHTAILAFKQMIGKWKRDGVKQPVAYFYGILMKKFEERYFEELFEMGFSVE